MITRLNPGPRMSAGVIHDNTVYLAGQVADDPRADITGQTRQVLAQIDGLLAEAGTDKSKIVMATIYLTDIGNFGAMNAVWENWVLPGQTPARATLEAKLVTPDYKIEIVVIAAR